MGPSVAQPFFVDDLLARRRVLGRRVRGGDEILRLVPTRAIGGGLTGIGCVGNDELAGHVALRDRPFFDAEDRLTGFAIQDVM